jgi:hypothetical protein
VKGPKSEELDDVIGFLTVEVELKFTMAESFPSEIISA